MKPLLFSVTRTSTGETIQATILQSADGRLYLPLRSAADAEVFRRLSSFLAPARAPGMDLLVVAWDEGKSRTVVVVRFTWVVERPEERVRALMRFRAWRPAPPVPAPARS